jgi:hypothetical protein
MPVLVGKLEYQRLLAGTEEQVNAHKGLQDLPRAEVLNQLPVWVGKVA